MLSKAFWDYFDAKITPLFPLLFLLCFSSILFDGYVHWCFSPWVRFIFLRWISTHLVPLRVVFLIW